MDVERLLQFFKDHHCCAQGDADKVDQEKEQQNLGIQPGFRPFRAEDNGKQVTREKK